MTTTATAHVATDASPVVQDGLAATVPPADSPFDPLTSTTRPLEDATITVRVIKSFEYRTHKALVLRNVDLTKTTVAGLVKRCNEEIKTAAGFKPYRSMTFDTLKLYTQAHSHKTMNLIINLDHDDWILSDTNKTLADYGAVNETELSLFSREAYDAFKTHPDAVLW